MTQTFDALGVPTDIARAMAARGITEPFAIQAATIPDALAGRDICGKAPTGSGKTIAFGIPMVARIDRAAPKRPRGLVLTPTRELAIQVADELRHLSDLRVLAVYGGAGIEPQLKSLRRGVDIVVACPGRLLDVIERKACDLRDVNVAVVDEADRMADMGFLPDVRRILDQTNATRQTLLFSATLDGAIDALVKEYQADPIVHEMPEEQTGDIGHHFWLAERPARAELTAEIVNRCGPTVVFSRTRHGADRIAQQIERLGISAAAIHGSRSQAQRERALRAFHRGDVQALVATDVAARGIHVEGVQCVIHFDIPADHKDYIHRSGRTGRAGSDGTVVALMARAQKRDASKLARQAGIDVDIVEPRVDVLPEGAHVAPAARRSRRPARSERPEGRNRPEGHNRPEGRGRPERRNRPEGRGRAERSERAETRSRPESRTRPESPNRPKSRTRSEDRDRRGGRERYQSTDRTESPKPRERPAQEAAHPNAGQGDGPNRAERRAARFGPPDSPERRSRAEAKARAGNGRSTEGRRGGGRRGGGEVRDRDHGPANREESDPLDRQLAGSAKVRPSGASRRKAKREAMLAAGITPTSGPKKRRR